jgi:hypothetical protein
MFCLVVSKHDFTVFLSHPKGKCLCRNEAMPLFLAAAVEFIVVPSAIKLEDEKDCRQSDPFCETFCSLRQSQ